ncbi:MAG: DUF4097 family beta strand repeat-containing protein [Bacteroidota bacterium]
MKNRTFVKNLHHRQNKPLLGDVIPSFPARNKFYRLFRTFAIPDGSSRFRLLTFVLLAAVTFATAGNKEIKKTIPLNDVRTVELIGFNGSSIAVKSWEKNEISINISVEYSSSNKDKEKLFFQYLDIVQEQIGEKMLLRFKEPTINNEDFSLKEFLSSLFSTTYSHLTISGDIFIPAAMNLSSDMRYGTHSIEGMKGTLRLSGVSNTVEVKNCADVQKIENDYGTTTVDHSGGDLQLRGESSNIQINDFSGSVKADVNYSDCKFNGIADAVTVVCSSGTVDIGDIGGNITLNVSYSTVSASNVKGSAVIESQSGTIRVKNTSGVSITAPYSNITIETVNGSGNPVYIQNASGHVEISNVTRDVTIEDSYSQLTARNIQGNVILNGTGSTFSGKKITGNITMENEYGDIRVSDLSASAVRIVNKNNSVNIEMLTKPAAIDIINEYGPVTVSFPEFTGDVRLKASYASIKTNLPIEVEEIGGGSIAIGKIGTGSSTMTIKTISGNIEVRQITQ